MLASAGILRPEAVKPQATRRFRLGAAESRYRQIALGLLPEGDAWLGGSAAIWSFQYSTAYWPILRRTIADDFADYVEAE